MRDRRAEQRENPVANRLHHVAVVAMHCVDRNIDGWGLGEPRASGSGTLTAALEAGRVFEMAMGTDPCQRGRALPAEFHSLRIIEAALRTAHSAPLHPL